MSVTIYGIKNCDTMKKARAWLDGQGVAYAFHDYKASGIAHARLEGWARQVGWEGLPAGVRFGFALAFGPICKFLLATVRFGLHFFIADARFEFKQAKLVVGERLARRAILGQKHLA